MSTFMQRQVACNATQEFVTFYATLKNKDLQLRKLGEWVKKHRDKMDYSQETAAEKVGLSRYQWLRIENGQSGTKRETILNIAKELNADEKEGLTLLAGLDIDTTNGKPTNARELYERLETLGITDLQMLHGEQGLELLGEDEIEEIWDNFQGSILIKAKRALAEKEKTKE